MIHESRRTTSKTFLQRAPTRNAQTAASLQLCHLLPSQVSTRETFEIPTLPTLPNMKPSVWNIGCICVSLSAWTHGFNLPSLVKKYTPNKSPSTLFPFRLDPTVGKKKFVGTISASSATTVIPQTEGNENDRANTSSSSSLVRSQGGRLSFSTKYGALNPFAIYYGLVAIFLGIPWFLALTACQCLYFVTGGRVDKMRRFPIFFSHLWGVVLGRLTGTMPKFEGKEILDKFYKEKRAAMFVANHNSWMDIPFLGYTIGWRNYKIISKAELAKVPILGKSIKCGGHVMVDRSNRKSQVQTLKTGMKWLEDGVHLCTFPEGTRSKTGHLLPFKNGAFKMAHKQNSPVVPVSIVGASNCQPSNWMFPCRPCRNICKVVVHEPIESEGKTEEELAEAVRQAIISGLPEKQHPVE